MSNVKRGCLAAAIVVMVALLLFGAILLCFPREGRVRPGDFRTLVLDFPERPVQLNEAETSILFKQTQYYSFPAITKAKIPGVATLKDGSKVSVCLTLPPNLLIAGQGGHYSLVGSSVDAWVRILQKGWSIGEHGETETSDDGRNP